MASVFLAASAVRCRRCPRKENALAPFDAKKCCPSIGMRFYEPASPPLTAFLSFVCVFRSSSRLQRATRASPPPTARSAPALEAAPVMASASMACASASRGSRVRSVSHQLMIARTTASIRSSTTHARATRGGRAPRVLRRTAAAAAMETAPSTLAPASARAFATRGTAVWAVRPRSARPTAAKSAAASGSANRATATALRATRARPASTRRVRTTAPTTESACRASPRASPAYASATQAGAARPAACATARGSASGR